jgi:hypothetical protein
MTKAGFVDTRPRNDYTDVVAWECPAHAAIAEVNRGKPIPVGLIARWSPVVLVVIHSEISSPIFTGDGPALGFL